MKYHIGIYALIKSEPNWKVITFLILDIELAAAIFDDVVLRHTLPVCTELGRCPIVNWDFSGAVSIFGPDALPVVHLYQD